MKTECTSCGADIFFRYTEGGKRMPLDREPVTEPAQGTYVLSGDRHCRAATAMFDPGPYYMNHWATCPTARLHKREKD